MDRSFGPTSWIEAVHSLWSSACSTGLRLALCFWRSAVSEGSLRILSLRSCIEIAFQLHRILNCFFSGKLWTQWLISWSFTAVFVVNSILIRSLPMRFKNRFSLMSLPIVKIPWLTMMKKLFRKMLCGDGFNLLVTGLGIAHESLAVFCLVCVWSGRV